MKLFISTKFQKIIIFIFTLICEISLPYLLIFKNDYVRSLKAFRAKKICSSKFKSWGVKPTQAKKMVPKKRNTEPIIEIMKLIISSLNNLGINKKEIPIKVNSIIEKLKIKKEVKFDKPEWDL